MKIIFDFNRTLYDPDQDALVPGVLEMLAEFSAQGAELHLVSKLEAGREDSLESLGIGDFFTTTAFVADKEHPIRRLIEGAAMPVYIVGDHLHNEIRIGNKYGAKTVWFKRGKFMSLRPESEYDVPWRIAESMEEVRAALKEEI